MPDLTIEHIRTCKANVSWSKNVSGSNGRTYWVHYGEMSGGDYSHGWTCECPAFQYSRKECKHIKAVKAEKCDWNWEAFCGTHAEANVDGTCPECGGPTTVIRVGV